MKKFYLNSFIISFNIIFQPLVIADIFDYADQQSQLKTAIKNDARLFYNKKSPDFNIDAELIRVKSITEDSISPGLKQFDIKKTITSQLDHPDLSVVDSRDLLRRIQRTDLMTMQYTAPAQMDLYKFYVTNANLRLILRYLQYLDLENHIQDPLMVLRKQAEMDCLRRQSTNIEIDQAFKNCVNRNQDVGSVFDTLNHPSRGNGYISGNVDLVKSALLRTAGKNDEWETVQEIMPIYEISKNKITYTPPEFDARRLFGDIRRENIGLIENDLKEYVEKRKVESDEGVINERIIRQLTILSRTEQVLAITKIATGFAYQQCQQRYSYAFSWLERSINNPQIEGGVKHYLRLALHEIKSNWNHLKEEYETNLERHHALNQTIEQVEERKLGLKNNE